MDWARRRRFAPAVLAALVGGCSLANPIPDITGGSAVAGAGGGAGSGASGGSAGSGASGGSAGSGASGATGGAAGCPPSAELCANFDATPWDKGFGAPFLLAGGTVQKHAASFVSAPAAALATVPAVPSGKFGAGALLLDLPATFTGAKLSVDLLLSPASAQQSTSVFILQLADPATSHSGLQLILGGGSQGLHETPNGFHSLSAFTFPSTWTHVELSVTLLPKATATLSVGGTKWLDAEPITPPPLSKPFFAVGIVQIDGPTSGETTVVVDNVVLDLLP